jgi:hypothetical protein
VRYQRIDRGFDFFGLRIVQEALSNIDCLDIDPFSLIQIHSQELILDIKERGLLKHIGKREHLPKPLVDTLVIRPNGVEMPGVIRRPSHCHTENERGLRDDDEVGEVNTDVRGDGLHVSVPGRAVFPRVSLSTS